MSEKHEISRDVKIVRYVTSWRVSSKLSKLFDRLGAITLTQHEIDAIYAYIHKDDEPVTEPDCNNCIYAKLCSTFDKPRNPDGCTNYAFIGELGNLLSQVTPDNKHGEWEPESAEVEKLVCGNCYYIGSGYCFRYPPTENELGVSETNRACGEHRLRE